MTVLAGALRASFQCLRLAKPVRNHPEFALLNQLYSEQNNSPVTRQTQRSCSEGGA
jgi:hypothetical protein